jgi:sulfide:quinone oxidoreductase
MADIRPVTPVFAVAPQLARGDMGAIAAAGYKTVIANRPDGEAADQMSLAGARAEAEAAGLAFIAIPFSGGPTMPLVEETMKALARAEAPVLAYCRSGTRSITVWALAQAAAGKAAPDDIVAQAAGAGYDLSPLKPTLVQLAKG